MKVQNNSKQTTLSYIIAIPDDFTLTKISNLEELLRKIKTKLGIPKSEITHTDLARTLDTFKSESDFLIKEMSEIQWIIFSILEDYQLVIHEFPTEQEYGRVINIMARGKQQRIEQILSGQYKSI